MTDSSGKHWEENTLTLGEKKLVYPFSPHWKNNLYRNSALRRFALLLGRFIIKPMAGMFPGMAPILTPQTAARGGRGGGLSTAQRHQLLSCGQEWRPQTFCSSAGTVHHQAMAGMFPGMAPILTTISICFLFLRRKGCCCFEEVKPYAGGMPLSRKAMVRSTMMANSPEQSSIKRPSRSMKVVTKTS